MLQKNVIVNLLIAILVFFTTVIYSEPTWMWIGTYAIDNYDGNGGGAANLTKSVATAENFWYYGQQALINEGASATPYRYVNRTNTAVTRESMDHRGDEREYNDFVFYQGHGWGQNYEVLHHIFLGSNVERHGWLSLYGDLKFGDDYNRWVWLNSEKTLEYDEQEYIEPAFNGVQVLMGHDWYFYNEHTNYPSYVTQKFWQRWVSYELPLHNAYFHAHRDFWYTYGIPSRPTMYSGEDESQNEPYFDQNYWE